MKSVYNELKKQGYNPIIMVGDETNPICFYVSKPVEPSKDWFISDNKNLFDKIKDNCKICGTTIEALCKDVNYNVHTYKNARADKRNLPFNIVVKMAKKLNISLEYLAEGI